MGVCLHLLCKATRWLPMRNSYQALPKRVYTLVYEPCGKSHGDRGELESSMCEAAMSGGTKEGDYKRSCK